jgi:hypothetical protein
VRSPRRDDLQALLEGIAYGEDPKITPGDRLRAAEQLRQLPDPEREGIRGLLADVPLAVALQEADLHLGEQTAARLLAGDPDQPVLSAALQRAVDDRAQQLLVAKLGDVEREIARRANDRAQQLYDERAFKLVQAQDADAATTAPTAPTTQPQGPQVPPPTLWPGERPRPAR